MGRRQSQLTARELTVNLVQASEPAPFAMKRRYNGMLEWPPCISCGERVLAVMKLRRSTGSVLGPLWAEFSPSIFRDRVRHCRSTLCAERGLELIL